MQTLIFGNRGKAFIRATRPPHGRVSGLPCPNCGSEISFLEQYHRHYCYSCGRYAPEGYGDRDAKKCPICGGVLSFVVQYDRFYCYRCNAYPSDEALAQGNPSAAAPVAETAPEPSSKPPAAQEVVQEPAEPEPAKVQVSEVWEESAPEPEPEPALSAKPPLVREVILEAKKPVLMDLCKSYDLDPTGTKEQLRERLLSYFDEIEEESPAEPEPVSEELPREPEEEPAAEVPESLGPDEPEPEESAPREASAHRDSIPTGPPAQPSEQRPSILFGPTPGETVAVVIPSTDTVDAGPATVEVRPVQVEAPIEHPCPTCGRELTFIPQYSRSYCYRCRAYAPLARAKNACPNCGATLRWIDQYERWWCDACRRYAPADLPKPERAVAAATTAAEWATAEPVARAIVVHRHRSPGSGIGLMALGMALFVVYEVVVDLPLVLPFNPGIVLPADLAWGVRFFSFVFVAAGAMFGLHALRDRT